jgi:cell fate (sporulation/competence/biofilm development) regulator YlbF (YheA/YmcA/DUF963 family)
MMIATLEGVGLLNEADVLARMVKESETAEHYQTSKNKLEHDTEAQKLIHRFIKMKDKYEEVRRFGRYHPDFDSVTAEVREVKRDLDLNQTIAAYKKAEEQMESLLNEVSQIIAYSVSDGIKVPTGNPFFDNMSCGGGCGSGGACGCG